MTDKLWQAMSYKRKKKAALSLQVKQLVEFVANDKTLVFKLKLELLKTCMYHDEFEGFPVFKDLKISGVREEKQLFAVLLSCQLWPL